MKGHFGNYGGQFVPETLMHPLEELEAAYEEAQRDPSFQAELDDLFHNYSGRPTALYFAERLTKAWSGATIYLKREDLNHTGAHKINNCLGQGLHEICRLAISITLDQKRIAAEEGIPRDSLAAFNTLKQKSVRSVFLQLQEGGDRRQEIGDNRFVDGDHIPLRLELFNFFQTWLHSNQLTTAERRKTVAPGNARGYLQDSVSRRAA